MRLFVMVVVFILALFVTFQQSNSRRSLAYAGEQSLPKRINLVGWRTVDKDQDITAYILYDTLSQTEFLLVKKNGQLVMSVIPKDKPSGQSTPTIPGVPTFKSTW